MQLPDLFRLLGQLPRLRSQLSIALDQSLPQPIILPLQSLDVVRLTPFRHASDSTPIRFAVQDPLNCYKDTDARGGRAAPDTAQPPETQKWRLV